MSKKLNELILQNENLKEENDAIINQMAILKDEMHKQKLTIYELNNCPGKIQNPEEFNNALKLIIENYKGKSTGKEYEEALKKIKDQNTLYYSSSSSKREKTDDNKKPEQKKKFLGIFG